MVAFYLGFHPQFKVKKQIKLKGLTLEENGLRKSNSSRLYHSLTAQTSCTQIVCLKIKFVRYIT